MEVYPHFIEASGRDWRWPNFLPYEPFLSCPHCGELVVHEPSMDRLQAARNILDRPMRLNSGHRCGIHNAHVSGAPLSQHKIIAFDISLRGQDRGRVYHALCKAGFTTFGFYRTFIHTDIRPDRRWFSKTLSPKEKEQWISAIS